VNGQKVDLVITYKYNSGNDTREKIGGFLKENAQKVGIKIELVVKEWTVFLEENKHHDFDMYCGGWVSDPISDDPKQIWHTQSYNGGSNYVGFGDDKTDATIDSLRGELEPARIAALYKEFQQEVNADVPYIFLYSPNNRLAISKRFVDAKGYVARPGYDDRSFGLGKVLATNK
jgi:peptide/nickel transport system substrate-binding protein